MKFSLRTPLAWKNLTHDMRRLLLVVAAIAFAVLLMCMELSFEHALFNSTLALVRTFDGELILCSKAAYTTELKETFSRVRLAQAMASEDVESAEPIYVELLGAMLTNPKTGEAAAIRVIAIEPNAKVIRLPEVESNARRLLNPRTALFDRMSKDIYGPIEAGSHVEVAGVRLEILDTFQLGTDFANDGNLVVSAETYRNMFGGLRGDELLARVDLGVVKLKAGADRFSAQKRLEEILPDDVAVLQRAEFEQLELDFWANATPIGYVFWLGTMMGFIVGVVICYQILYADIADHMAEFATLKAMGYANRYFTGVVLQEAVLVCLLGFGPGLAASQAICVLVANRTGLPLTVEPSIIVTVLVLSIAMCIVSGLLTIRKVMSADPAELFR